MRKAKLKQGQWLAETIGNHRKPAAKRSSVSEASCRLIADYRLPTSILFVFLVFRKPRACGYSAAAGTAHGVAEYRSADSRLCWGRTDNRTRVCARHDQNAFL